MKKILLVSSLLCISINILPMAEAIAMEQAAKTTKSPTPGTKENSKIHSPVSDSKDTSPMLLHGKTPHMTESHHEANSSMHKTMKETHTNTLKMPKIAPIPPMPSKIKPHEPSAVQHDINSKTTQQSSTKNSLSSPTEQSLLPMDHVSHAHHIEDGHSKIQIAINSMNKGIESMKEAVKNLTDVQSSILKIKSAITELLNTHLNN